MQYFYKVDYYHADSTAGKGITDLFLSAKVQAVYADGYKQEYEQEDYFNQGRVRCFRPKTHEQHPTKCYFYVPTKHDGEVILFLTLSASAKHHWGTNEEIDHDRAEQDNITGKNANIPYQRLQLDRDEISLDPDHHLIQLPRDRARGDHPDLAIKWGWQGNVFVKIQIVER